MKAAPPFDRHLGLVGHTGLAATGIAIVDTCFLFDQAASRVEHASLGSGVDAPRIGSTRWFAPVRVLQELRTTYETAARSRGVESTALASALETDLLPSVRFVELPKNEPITDPRVEWVARSDPDDVDCARLGVFLAPCHVLSADRDLRRPGLAPPTREALALVVAASVEIDYSDGMKIGGALVVRTAAAGAAASVRALEQRFEVPVWLIGLSGVALAASTTMWLASTPERRRMLRELASCGVATIVEMIERRDQARRMLDTTSIERHGPPTLASQLARILAVGDGALLVCELRDELGQLGDYERSSVDKLLAVLHEHPAFVQAGRYRWKLGRGSSLVDTSTDPSCRQRAAWARAGASAAYDSNE